MAATRIDRIDRIDRAIDVLVKHSEALSEAMNADFFCRPREVNLMTDVTGSISCLKHSKKYLKTWMRSEKRPTMYFGQDKAEQQRFLTRTTSGGVSINDVMFHMLQKDLPFGGVGPSGMGAYHGIEGFKTFSHAKGVYRQPRRIPIAKLAGFMPPYGPASEKVSSRK